MTDLHASYRKLVLQVRKLSRLEEALKLLEWDQATYMPPGAHGERAEQTATLAAVVHDQRIAPQLLSLIDELAAHLPELSPSAAVDVRELKWRADRLRRVPTALQSARAQAQSLARSAWSEARETGQFQLLAPHLEEVVRLEREYAQAIAGDGDLYQVLLEEYEPGIPESLVREVFEQLRKPLRQFAQRLTDLAEQRRKYPSVLRGSYPISSQRELNRYVAERVGFDFSCGRMDESAHPFSISIGRDYRITTRYDVSDLRVGLYSTLHEVGHALYEQGLLPEAHGLPRGSACSLGIHESQSRLWENFVGRSEAFWRFLLPQACRVFPTLRNASLDAILADVNEAHPTFIRTEADEITYNLHVLVRYELERKLIEGELQVMDLPDAWNAKMRELLGIVPPSAREGVLQDIHWPSGAFGYFPTYTLGNVFAAQMMEAVDQQIGPLSPHIERGDFTPLLDWLTRNIYHFGQQYRSTELVFRLTGSPPSARALLHHLHLRLEWLESHARRP